MEKVRILIVEDSPDVASLLERGLIEEGFQVSVAKTGNEAMRLFDESWNLVILDLMLPDVPGESLLDYLTQKVDAPPALILTARTRLEDKVALFQRGCDDYLTKPFAFEELIGRVRALLRRSPRPIPDAVEYEGITLDSSTHVLVKEDKKITLTPKEFAICKLLVREPGRVFTRRELLHSIWGLGNEPKTNFIEVHLANLRKKLEPIKLDKWLQTVRGSGLAFSKNAIMPIEIHGS